MADLIGAKPNRRVQFLGANVATFYANSLHLEVSPWDFKLCFGQTQKATDDELVVNELVHVYVSPQHAKAIVNVLQTQLARYESEVGPLPVIPTPTIVPNVEVPTIAGQEPDR
jgi:hypothetical protein